MSKRQHVRHLRHRKLEERGLSRGANARRRLRHLESWIDRIVSRAPAQGGLAGSATPIAVTPANATNDFGATAHGLETGEQVLIVGTAAPTGLVLSGPASSVLTFTLQPTDGETITIDGRIYRFEASDLGELHRSEAGIVKIGANLAATIANLVAAIDGDPAGNVRAAGNQTLLTVPADSTTLTIGAVVYTFLDNPTGDNVAPNAVDVKIQPNVDDQLGALAAAINGEDVYTAHPLVRASVSPGTNVLVLTGRDLGPAANLTVAQSAAHWTPANLTGGLETHTQVTEAHDRVRVGASDGTTLTAEARDDEVAGADIAAAESAANASWAGATLTGGSSPDYFVIVNDANTFQLADTEADAIAGTFLSFSDNGTAVSVVRQLSRDAILAILRGRRADALEGATDIDAL